MYIYIYIYKLVLDIHHFPFFALSFLLVVLPLLIL